MLENKIRVSEYIGITELCELTGWARNTAYKYLKDIPEIKKYHFGRFLRFNRDQVIEYVHSQTK